MPKSFASFQNNELVYQHSPKLTTGWYFSVFSIMITELNISYMFQFVAVIKFDDAQIVLIFVRWRPCQLLGPFDTSLLIVTSIW